MRVSIVNRKITGIFIEMLSPRCAHIHMFRLGNLQKGKYPGRNGHHCYVSLSQSVDCDHDCDHHCVSFLFH
jgi:hypothetical protein